MLFRSRPFLLQFQCFSSTFKEHIDAYDVSLMLTPDEICEQAGPGANTRPKTKRSRAGRDKFLTPITVRDHRNKMDVDN